MNYIRNTGESDEELIYRICSEKDKIGTWQDVASILNKLTEQDYGESTYRKKFQIFQKMFDGNHTKFVDNNDYLKQIQKEKEELRKERIKLQTLNIERNRIDRSEAKQELFYEFVGQVVETLPLPEFKSLLYDVRSDSEINYVALITDIHYGAKFQSINNIYSPTVAKERFEFLTGYLIKFVEAKKISKISIANLGDTIQGVLRLSDLKLNDSSIVKATVEVCRLIANMLNELSAYTYVDYYHVPLANHTQIRVLGAKASELADEDLEYLIGNYIKDLCKYNERIHVKLANDGEDYVSIEVPGNEIIAMHGHQVKNIEGILKERSILHQTMLDYVLLGHYHGGKILSSHEGCCNDAEVIVASSFVGSDPYSDSIGKGSKASVTILGFDSIYGCTENYKYILN